jgi:hypothetical protein
MGMPSVDEVVESVGSRGFVFALLELTKSNIVDNE